MPEHISIAFPVSNPSCVVSYFVLNIEEIDMQPWAPSSITNV